jgi:hypothetical protein
MDYKLQLSPISPKLHPRLGFNIRSTATRWENARFFRSWLVFDSGWDPGLDSNLKLSHSQGSVNWSFVLGLAVMVAVSASGWYGIALLVRHFLR